MTITAAGDRQRRLDLDEVALAMHDTARHLVDGAPRALVASIEIPITHRLGSDPSENLAVMASAIGQPDAAALVASGGWCLPSMPLFDMLDVGPDATGLIDLPTVAARGGAMIPLSPTFGDVDGALWTWTEQDDIDAADPDGPTKPCLHVPCPTWVEARLRAEGLCLTAGNLTDRAWPELTRSYLNVVVGSRLHRLSAAKVATIEATATAATPAASMTVSDAAGDLLGVIGLAIADLRSRFRLGRRRAIEVALPEWASDMLNPNVAMRAGDADLLDVSDARVAGWFVARGARVQLLSDYTPLSDGVTPATEWPSQVPFMVWVSGSYTEITGGRIDLGVVRDSTLNATNDYTAAWAETFYQVVQRGPAARKYVVPVSVDGVTACCADAAA